ncbi:MAG: hypothetical protein AAF598_14455, partial [Bacteroidota bacterium]
NPQITTPSMIYDSQQVHSIEQAGLYLWFNGEVSFYDPNTVFDLEQLQKELQYIRRNKAFFALLVHENGKGRNMAAFADLGFSKLSSLGPNQAYVAFEQAGLVSEHIDPSTLSFALDLPQAPSASEAAIQSWANDPSRFIAHAGGLIEGLPYTNSLEALDASYRKGFRWFELDILQTSDGAFVAAHDWGGWKKATGYSGPVPVDLATFQKYPIHGRFQALDLSTINAWFANHPDAILVTDKIDFPIDFSAAFAHPDRLYMELFSWTAVNEALDYDIALILNEQLMWGIEANPVSFLQQKGIEKVSVSRTMISSNKELFHDLKAAGIQVYLYHLNQGDRRNETYVLKYDLAYAYGMYADDWSFPK